MIVGDGKPWRAPEGDYMAQDIPEWMPENVLSMIDYRYHYIFMQDFFSEWLTYYSRGPKFVGFCVPRNRKKIQDVHDWSLKNMLLVSQGIFDETVLLKCGNRNNTVNRFHDN